MLIATEFAAGFSDASYVYPALTMLVTEKVALATVVEKLDEKLHVPVVPVVAVTAEPGYQVPVTVAPETRAPVSSFTVTVTVAFHVLALTLLAEPVRSLTSIFLVVTGASREYPA
ncbi:MAG TPA: hypothetical protein VLI39_00285 [Sedimentisphaerales bacterium]|nr:hypothetical protein [Sedimentisphaerales bacterium]